VSLLACGVVRIRERNGQRVSEDRCRFVKSDAVLAGIGAGFLLIPSNSMASTLTAEYTSGCRDVKPYE